MAELNDFDLRLLRGPNFAHLVTLDGRGAPRSTVTWVDADPVSGHVLVNSAIGRVKDRDIRRDPRVSVSIQEEGDGYRYVAIQGIVDGFITGEEADRHIDLLNRRYHDGEPWTFRPGQARVIYRIRPERIVRYDDD
jgi:PPOX class probable F420-dependent enzyme